MGLMSRICKRGTEGQRERGREGVYSLGRLRTSVIALQLGFGAISTCRLLFVTLLLPAAADLASLSRSHMLDL
ncbi:hypothetical protein LX36DRAFT_399777 [Colletotrichum falcatum]|nr:hypothetical protein LX36DRAFT_399777 [Colletotrichum falcatum]